MHDKQTDPSIVLRPGLFDTGHIQNQGQARGYGHITRQYLTFGRTTGGQHFQLEYIQRYLKNYFALSYYKNLEYWWPFAVGFMSLCLLVSK